MCWEGIENSGNDILFQEGWHGNFGEQVMDVGGRAVCGAVIIEANWWTWDWNCCRGDGGIVELDAEPGMAQVSHEDMVVLDGVLENTDWDGVTGDAIQK